MMDALWPIRGISAGQHHTQGTCIAVPDITAKLDIPVRRYKIYAGAIARLGRPAPGLGRTPGR